jgi:hypothetical protein
LNGEDYMAFREAEEPEREKTESSVRVVEYFLLGGGSESCVVQGR